MDFSLAELSDRLRAREFSSRELTLALIEKIEREDPAINSVISLTAERALAEAEQADARRAAGDAGRLTGIPLLHKDIFCTSGVRTSCGSRMLDNFVPPYDATVIARLRAAGAIMLGKTNLDEFAMGSSNENSYYGVVRNPWDRDRVPGGSSGGSAAAVAMGFAPGATGTDTGGSIRQPAAFCGITGLKPTYGRVSRLGMVAFASSLDQGGPMARSARDCALLLNVMAGFDPADSTSSDRPDEDYIASIESDIAGLRIGLPREYFGDGLDPGIEAQVRLALAQYEAMGAELVEISLPHSRLALPAYYVIAPAEASTNLSRYDGVRYGHRCENPANLHDLYTRSREEGFGAEVKRRILVGTFALSAGYYDAYYRKAQQIRRLIKQDFDVAFDSVDVLMGPTTPHPAWTIGAKSDDPVSVYLEDIFTLSVNLAGLPAMSIPAGFSEGLPVGLQLIGNYFCEAQLLNIAHRFQDATDWHERRPPI